MQTRITAILYDYDGTLCPTNSVMSDQDAIPENLDHILWEISGQLPVCIISSKDYHFLHPKTKFARILSCIMGIETITLKLHDKVEEKKIAKANIGFSSNMIKQGCSDDTIYFLRTRKH